MAESGNTELTIFSEHFPARHAAQRNALGRRVNPLRGHPIRAYLVLPFETRQKARHRARLSTGVEIGIQLPRGTVLRGGDRLRGADGTVVEVVAAPERVSTVRSRELQELARVAYHLGNRHVALEVGDGWVRYLTDHVLDAMVVQLGLPVAHEVEPFEPEAGAYGGHSHSHAQTHSHAHSHGHAHAHSHATDLPSAAASVRAPDARVGGPATNGGSGAHEPRYVYGPGNWLKNGRKP